MQMSSNEVSIRTFHDSDGHRRYKRLPVLVIRRLSIPAEIRGYVVNASPSAWRCVHSVEASSAAHPSNKTCPLTIGHLSASLLYFR